MKTGKLVIGFVLSLVLAGGCLDSAELPDEWPCSSNADCASGEKCLDPNDYEGKRCKPASFCLSESDCASNEFCATQTCKKAQCKDSSQCGAYACNTVSYAANAFQCFTTCTTSYSQCAPGFVCASGACVARQCTGADPSACLGYACLGDGVCGTSCASSSDCAPGYSCVTGGCVLTGENRPCTSAFHCTTPPYTLCEDGLCSLVCEERPCSVEGEACDTCNGTSYVCGSAGKCRLACVGAACGYDGDVYCGGCSFGYTCTNNVCVDEY